MRTLGTTCLAAALALLPALLPAAAHADDCPGDKVTFNFDSIEIRTAFAVLANHAGLRPQVDSAITYAGPLKFSCLEWRTAAQRIADQYKLGIRVENGALYVWKKG